MAAVIAAGLAADVWFFHLLPWTLALPLAGAGLLLAVALALAVFLLVSRRAARGKKSLRRNRDG